ncbi:acyl-CoA dehydrogenase [Rhodococcus sp. OK519]|uniref:acyl-CoA dehydrogenase family protein n=1 Tax=Rhodococcus sp. OK519 TaxID=2135729 RepID=UPI000D389FFD|nr:acyl-CoA dehydrogenase [Rhodococcus sp. OK519]
MTDFAIDPKLSEQLDWIRELVRKEIEPLDLEYGHESVIYDKSHPVHDRRIRPLQERVRERGLWSCHLTPDLGGQGYGQVALAHMNEILGRSAFAPSVFGCQAPDSGNAEILAHYGSDAQRARYLEPLLRGEISSCFSMTEPHGGADPTAFTTRAVLDGDEWVIDGEKWFSSSAAYAAFFIVMAVTDPDAAPHRRASMFLVPADTDGIEIVRHTGLGLEPDGAGNHPYVRYRDVRAPVDGLMGEVGGAFEISQARLGGGRLHHAMRTVGAVQRCLDMVCERALSRTTRGASLARNPVTQQKIAEAWVELTQFRLQVLHAAWVVDTQGARAARREIAGVKIATPHVYHRAVLRTMHLHGALGISNEMPLAKMLLSSVALGVADGPTEVHEATLARDVLAGYLPSPTDWPSEHLPSRRDLVADRAGARP